jgi:non-heme chloroperoxidase
VSDGESSFPKAAGPGKPLQRRRLLRAALAAPAALLVDSRTSLAAGEPLRAAGSTTDRSLPPHERLSTKTPDGVNIAIQSWGKTGAPEILLIHGLNQSHLSWMRQLGSDLLLDHRVVTYDLRGHGDSDKPQTPVHYSEGSRWGDELAAVIEASQLRRPTLVGWSLGGVVILNYLARYGNSGLAAINFVDAWTTLDAAVYAPESERLTDALASADFLVRLRAIRSFLAACFHIAPDPHAFELMLTFNAMAPVAVHQGITNVTLDGADTALRALSIPVLVTHGAKDRLFKLAAARYTAGTVQGAQLSIYPNAGHSPFYEEPARFNAELRALLARVRS